MGDGDLSNSLTAWQSPDSLLEAAEQVLQTIGCPDIFMRNEAKPAREAYCAAKFAQLAAWHNDVEVRLGVDPRGPDFFLRTGRGEMAFELTEILEPSRRRGEEYRRLYEQGGEEITLGGDPKIENDLLLDVLPSAVEKKAAKQYIPMRSLLLYPQFGWPSILRSAPALRILHENVKPFSSRFLSVWITMGPRAVRLTPATAAGRLLTLGEG
jgi:hypothetical protein